MIRGLVTAALKFAALSITKNRFENCVRLGRMVF